MSLLRKEIAADPRVEERFNREARACAAVAHPNITAIYEVNRHEGLLFVHRDIKPENIMVMAEGVVKVLDFGLAAFTAGAQFSVCETAAADHCGHRDDAPAEDDGD